MPEPWLPGCWSIGSSKAQSSLRYGSLKSVAETVHRPPFQCSCRLYRNLCRFCGCTGTFAADLLDYLREQHPSVYESVRYTIVDISVQLSSNQTSRLELRGHTSKAYARFVVCRCFVSSMSHVDVTPVAWSCIGCSQTHHPLLFCGLPRTSV